MSTQSERTSPGVLAEPDTRRLFLASHEPRGLLPNYQSRALVSWKLTGSGNFVYLYLVRQVLESADVPPTVLPIVEDIINASNDVTC